MRVRLCPPPEAPALRGRPWESRSQEGPRSPGLVQSMCPVGTRLKGTAQVSCAGWALPGGGREHVGPSGQCLVNQETMLCVECGQMDPAVQWFPVWWALQLWPRAVTWPVQNTSEQDEEGPARTSERVRGVGAKGFMPSAGLE